MRTTSAWTVGVASAALLLGACSTGSPAEERAGSSPSVSPAPGEASSPAHGHGSGQSPRERTPLRAGERIVDVRMPSSYTPSAPGKGTDDYRCFLLDPELDEDAFITGLDVLPGNRDVVHHVILFRVPPESTGSAVQMDMGEEGPGWTCFGGSGVGGAGAALDDAPENMPREMSSGLSSPP